MKKIVYPSNHALLSSNDGYATISTVNLLLVILFVVLGVSGCTEQINTQKEPISQQQFHWKLVTSWPKNYPGLGTAPEQFARWVNEMSQGQLQIKVYAAGELVPALEVFDAVSSGAVHMGHSAAYYWKGKVPALQFFTAVPFGLTAQEMNGWLHYGGGMELYRKVYAPLNIIPLAGGNTGVQMAGWFNKEIHSVQDLKGLKMRVPGLAGEILNKLGVATVTLPGSELYTAMQTGVIDAAEWVAPYNDMALGLHEVAQYYYYPGWHEPGPMLEFIIHRPSYNQLPLHLRTIVETAARAVNQNMLDEYTSLNNQALNKLTTEHGVQLRQLPTSVLLRLRRIAQEVISEMVATDPQVQEVYSSFHAYAQKVQSYHKISEHAFLNLRTLENKQQ